MVYISGMALREMIVLLVSEDKTLVHSLESRWLEDLVQLIHL